MAQLADNCCSSIRMHYHTLANVLPQLCVFHLRPILPNCTLFSPPLCQTILIQYQENCLMRINTKSRGKVISPLHLLQLNKMVKTEDPEIVCLVTAGWLQVLMFQASFDKMKHCLPSQLNSLQLAVVNRCNIAFSICICNPFIFLQPSILMLSLLLQFSRRYGKDAGAIECSQS